MEIMIIPVEDHQSYSVNGHAVYKNHNKHWVSATDMTTKEWSAFRQYEKSVINNPRFKQHTKATYKTK